MTRAAPAPDPGYMRSGPDARRARRPGDARPCLALTRWAGRRSRRSKRGRCCSLPPRWHRSSTRLSSSSTAARPRTERTPSEGDAAQGQPHCRPAIRRAHRPRFCRRTTFGQSHPGTHRRQHHAVLADKHRGVGCALVLGRRTRKCSCGRPGSHAGLDSGRLHDVPRGDLADPAQLGREGVPQRHLLQRGGQGRSLRRLGGTGALLARVARRLPPTALADTRDLGVTEQDLCGAKWHRTIGLSIVRETVNRFVTSLERSLP